MQAWFWGFAHGTNWKKIKLEACYEKTGKGSTNGFATDFARTKAPHTISLEVSKRFSSFFVETWGIVPNEHRERTANVFQARHGVCQHSPLVVATHDERPVLQLWYVQKRGRWNVNRMSNTDRIYQFWQRQGNSDIANTNSQKIQWTVSGIP